MDQVQRARERETFTRADELNDIRAVLGTTEGRRLLWRILGQTKAFESVFHKDAGLMAYYAGRQDFGHFLIDEIGQASPEAWVMMQREANKMEANVAEPESTEPIDPDA